MGTCRASVPLESLRVTSHSAWTKNGPRSAVRWAKDAPLWRRVVVADRCLRDRHRVVLGPERPAVVGEHHTVGVLRKARFGMVTMPISGAMIGRAPTVGSVRAAAGASGTASAASRRRSRAAEQRRRRPVVTEPSCGDGMLGAEVGDGWRQRVARRPRPVADDEQHERQDAEPDPEQDRHDRRRRVHLGVRSSSGKLAVAATRAPARRCSWRRHCGSTTGRGSTVPLPSGRWSWRLTGRPSGKAGASGLLSASRPRPARARARRACRSTSRRRPPRGASPG